VEFDLTHLKDRIQLYIPPDNDHGYHRYEVTIKIKLKVIDRHLEFTAYWPPDDENAAAIQGSQAGFDLSAVFPAGTA
jgi:hypothetical protein